MFLMIVLAAARVGPSPWWTFIGIGFVMVCAGVLLRKQGR